MLKLTAKILLYLCVALSASVWGQEHLALQQGASGQQGPAGQPNVRVNYLNVCAPSDDDQKEIAAAFSLVPVQPTFSLDFEVARGRSIMSEQPSAANLSTLVTQAPASNWVRIRHEFGPGAALSNAQYSFSMDAKGMTETLVLRVRDASKSGVLQVSIQDSVTTGTPEAVLATDTPADRIRIERSGKASVVLARCAGADQARYEALFQAASRIMMRYRVAMNVKRTVPTDLARIGETGAARKSAAKRKP